MMAATAVAQVTPYGWRGPERNGIYPETGLLKQWPAAGPQKLWETLDVGKGYSSPVIVGDRLYITGMNEDQTKE
ncbi:MAG: alcohol dehydrogenase, partial [Alistipes sp.]|nr:alcohol dehydrogenase [Alistipes sp.]